MATEPKPDLFTTPKSRSEGAPEDGESRDFARGEEGLRDASRRNGGHVERLTEVLEIVGKAPRAKTCDAILGIIEEGKGIMNQFEAAPALDAGLVAAAQAVEHYEHAMVH